MREQKPEEDLQTRVENMRRKLEEHFDGVWVFGFHRDTGTPFITGNFMAEGPCADIMETFLQPLHEWAERHREQK